MAEYTVTQTAHLLDVSASTVRRWADSLYNVGALSDLANPARGERRYTAHDVAVLAWAMQQKTPLNSREDVIALAALGVPEDDLPPIEALETQQAKNTAITALSPEAVGGALGELATAQSRIADTLEALSASQNIEGKLDHLSQRLDAIEAKLSRLEARLDTLPGVLKRRWKD